MDFIKEYVDLYENLKKQENTSLEQAIEQSLTALKSGIESGEFKGKYAKDKSLALSEFFEGILSKEHKASKGVFYTDEILAGYMADKVIDMYLEGIGKRDVLKRLKGMRLLDPSCGCGAFVVACFKKLIGIYEKVDAGFEYEKACRHILGSNICAVDIDEMSLEICRQRLRIITGIADIEMELHKEDFITGFEKEGFDVIVGNPPYIGEKGNKEIFQKARESDFGREHYEKGMDYFYYFIEKSVQIANDKGLVCFITTNYWTGADYSVKLREKIRSCCGFRWVLDFNDFRVFPQATGQHNMIFILQNGSLDAQFDYEKLQFSRGKLSRALDIVEKKDRGQVSKNRCNSCEVFDENGRILFMDTNARKITEKMILCSDLVLGDIATINQGIVSGADRVTQRNIKHLEGGAADKEGIFVLRESELYKVGISDKRHLEGHPIIKPFYKSKDIKRYSTTGAQESSSIQSGKTEGGHEGERLYILYIDKDTRLENHPEILFHLKRFKPILQRRREAQNGTIPWFSLHWPRKRGVFEDEKIVSPQRARLPVFGHDDSSWYASADVYYITRFKLSPLYILGVLNSKLSHYWLYNRGKRKGEYLELYQKPLSRMPVVSANADVVESMNKIVKALVEEAKERGENSKDFKNLYAGNLQKGLDRIVYDIYGLSEREISIVENFFTENF